MDKKLLDFLRDTLRPDQAELMEVANGMAEYCEDNPSMPPGAIDFLNKLCSQFPFLIKRPDYPPIPSNPPSQPPPQPPSQPPSQSPRPRITREQLRFFLRQSYRHEPQSEREGREEQERENRLNKRNSSLLHIQRCLEKHQLELRAEEARLKSRTEQAADRTKKSMAVLSVENGRFNELFDTLVKQVEKLNFYLDRNGADPPIFFSHLPLDEFFDAQKEYTNELTKFSKVAFSKDLSEFASKSQNECTPADVFTGGDEEKFEKLKSDILRVQSMKSLSLMKKIRLQLKLAELKAKRKCLDEWKEKVERAEQEDDTNTIFRITQETDEEIKKSEENFREECKKIPEMLEKIAMREISEFFDEELKRKISLQNQVLERQEQLVHFLKHQYTMFNLVAHLHQAELEKVKELTEAIDSVKSIVEEVSEASERLAEYRNEMEEDAKKSSVSTPRLIIPSSDKGRHSMYKILKLENKSRFPTYQVLAEAIMSLQLKLCASERGREVVQETNLSLAILAEQKLKGASSKLSEFEHHAEQLVDGPKGRRHLEGLLREFEHKMKDLLHTVNSKKQELLQHPTHALERRMAPAFYTDRQLYSQLKHKVDSIKQNQ